MARPIMRSFKLSADPVTVCSGRSDSIATLPDPDDSLEVTMRFRVRSVLLVLAAIHAVTLLAAGYEGPRTFASRDVLPASLVQSPLFTVGPQAPTDGYFHDFTIKSEYGDFHVEG